MPALTFGLGIPAAPEPGFDPVAFGRLAEELGFDFLSVSDHPADADGSFEAWTVLSWIAASTTRIKLATRVLGVPYRPPAIVAKMAETFDRLSGGRLIPGLGGGYCDDEFVAFGLPVPTAREKADGPADAIRISRGLWSKPSFSYRGAAYHTDAAGVAPLPEHRIPIWLGTFGPRALALTGELADGWIPSLGSAPPEQVPALRSRILTATVAARRDPEEITCAYHLAVDPSPGAPDESWVVSGPVGKIAETLAGFVGLGFTALSLVPGGAAVISAIDGAAGVGKSALALHWAHQAAAQFPDGQLYLNLHGDDAREPAEPAEALAGLLRALGTDRRQIPSDPEERAAQYRSLPANRRVLVLIDNVCLAQEVRLLLPGAGGCMALITSRDNPAELVARDGAQSLELDPPAPDEANKLLRILMGERVDTDHHATARLADLCHGLPLSLCRAAEIATSHPDCPLVDLVNDMAARPDSLRPPNPAGPRGPRGARQARTAPEWAHSR